MTIFNIFSLLGGLGMFLYGMKIMGDNLEKCAGGKLEKILERLTSNKYKGILLGAFVTAVIQSSGAVTVMLVGFVNSGIMQLEQTVGVIMGSNIGTTVTAWILSLSGISGESVLIQMLKPDNFSPILIFIGGFCVLFLKKDKIKNVGRIILGFGLLMYGMSVMTVAMSPLSESDSLKNVLTLFNNPILGIIAGFVLTTMLQSSSASVGVVQALSATGAISFGTAIPILTGQNIGSCTTALISTTGAGKNAKQTAFIHLYFNIIGTILFLTLYYVLDAILKFTFTDSAINGFQIAMVHTIFNVLTTIVMLPFTNKLIALAKRTVKDMPEVEVDAVDIMRIDERLLKTPDVAIEPCKNAIKAMAELTQGNVDLGLGLIYDFNEKKFDRISQHEGMIDNYEDVLAIALTKISAKKTNAQTSHTASLFIHAINDIERIGDHAMNIAESAKDIYNGHFEFPEDTKKELKVLRHLLEDIMAAAFTAFKTTDVQLAQRVEPMEEVMDYLSKKLKSRAVVRMQDNECAVQAGIAYLDIINDFERISDHCSNLAIYVIQDNYAVHEYSDNLKKDNIEFKNYYSELLDKYAISL